MPRSVVENFHVHKVAVVWSKTDNLGSREYRLPIFYVGHHRRLDRMIGPVTEAEPASGLIFRSQEDLILPVLSVFLVRHSVYGFQKEFTDPDSQPFRPCARSGRSSLR